MNKYDIDYSLTNFDIYRILKNKCNIVEYSQLYNVKKLSDIMSYDLPLVILYRSSQQTAHWCCLFQHKNRSIEFHDSYGLIIDMEINKIHNINQPFYDSYYNNGYKKLSELIIKGNYNEIIYNQYHLQLNNKPNINTCGRHVCSRLIFKDLSLEEYIKIMNFKNHGLDYQVLKLTNKFI